MKEDVIKVLKVKPHEHPEVYMLKNTLEAMQEAVGGYIDILWTIVNKKDTIFKYIFRERLDSLPIPECCFHFVWCQIA